MAGPLLRLDDVGLAYHSRRGIQAVLQHISFSLAQGEHLTVSGPSGCGKSPLLRLIAGLQAPTEGQIYFAGQKMTAPRPDLAIVFQDYGLFPWKTVEENILLPGRLHGSPLDKDQLASLLDTLGLTAVRHHYPGELSGGQKQRTALGRAMAMQPKLLLLDEPFSALDPVTRSELQNEVVKLQKRFHKTIVFVTHDMDEAIKMADRICIIQNGQIAQFDRPEEILKRPANAYVEEFVGKNRLWGNPAYIHAEDIMKKAVIHISKNRTVLQALQIMRHNTVDSLLVTSGRERRLEGIVWLRNLQEVQDYSASLEDYITQDYISVYADTSLQEIIDTVDYDASGIIPVVSHENELLGGLTKSGLLATLSKRYRRDSTEEAEE